MNGVLYGKFMECWLHFLELLSKDDFEVFIMSCWEIRNFRNRKVHEGDGKYVHNLLDWIPAFLEDYKRCQ